MANFNTLARVAKLAALLCFFLPWILVSCSGNEIAHGSGWDMMVGHLHPSDQINGMQAQFGNEHSQREMDRPAPEIFAIAAFAVIALGLALSFALKRRGAAIAMLASSALGIALCFGAFAHISAEMNQQFERQERKGDGDENELRRQLGEQMQSALRIEKLEGFWATIIALVAAAVLAGATLTTPVKPAAAPEDSDA